MIISRTPFRVSFFGGGTDYPDWYLYNGGSVLATAIDKYCYISCRYLPPFFEHRIRLVYSVVENCRNRDEIRHPSVRETLKFLDINRGIEIHHDGDLPARSGMGSSSAFTVGLLHALYALQGRMPNKKQLALESIYIEQSLIKETVGSQDQVSTAYGKLNRIDFFTNGDIEVKPLTLPKDLLKNLDNHLMLFYTGIMRTASDIAKSYVDDIHNKEDMLKVMHQMVDEGISILHNNSDITDFGRLMHEAWQVKKKLSNKVTNPSVDELYELARRNGALGGKITGAGGGGFLLLFVPPDKQPKVREALGGLIHVPFRFDVCGSQVIFLDAEQKDYSMVERDNHNRDIVCFRDMSSVCA